MPLERARRKAGPPARSTSPARSTRYNRKVKIPSSKSSSAAELELIDALFKKAGLARHPRGRTAAIVPRKIFDQKSPHELCRPSAPPRAAGNGVHWLAVAGWSRFSWLWHGFSTRKGGVSRAYCPEDACGELNLGFTAEESRERVLRNRRLLAEAVTGDATVPFATLRQIHSTMVRVIDAAGAPLDPQRLPTARGDGLMTAEPGILLGIQTADCIPVLVADRRRRAVAAFHAGWRGTVQRIVENGIGRMRLEFGSRPEDLVAAIGPGIGPCCYAVGEEVLSGFESQFVYFRDLFHEVDDSNPIRTRYPMLFLTQRAPGHSPIGPSLHLDLFEANKRQLLDAGLNPAAIKLVGGCTSCQPQLFFSHRASRGHAGRMLNVIGIRKGAG